LRRNASAQAIGLALPELAADATKYGALSTDRDRVDVTWRIVGDARTMSRIECGEPPSAPASHRLWRTPAAGRQDDSTDGD
jgi:two-component sensor histidine kinase